MLVKLRKLVEGLIPDTQTNIFSIIINGIDAGFNSLDNMLNTFKRDRNILETENPKALRSLVAENGYEPNLLIPAKGFVILTIDSSFFNENGNEIFLPAYSKFQNKFNGLTYYYDSNIPLKLKPINDIPLTEGLNVVKTFTVNELEQNQLLTKVYLQHENIANKSITVSVDGVLYTETKSLINKFDGNYFIVKYSNSIDNPMLIYVTNTNLNAVITINYKLCNGINGILTESTYFETDTFVDLNGKLIGFDSGRMSCINNLSGFNFAGNGTSIDTMKSQIGFNHNINVIYDTNSYRNFIGMYSNILLNKIKLRNNNKSINDIYISKKLLLNDSDEYNNYIKNDKYIFTKAELKDFSNIILENEYCLSTHNLFNAEVNKYAFQIEMLKKDDFVYKEGIKKIIYDNFMLFLNNKNHIFDVDKEFKEYMTNNNFSFDYFMFNQEIEKTKLLNKVNYSTKYIIRNDEMLPILFGNFNVANDKYEPQQLFFDINFIIN